METWPTPPRALTLLCPLSLSPSWASALDSWRLGTAWWVLCLFFHHPTLKPCIKLPQNTPARSPYARFLNTFRKLGGGTTTSDMTKESLSIAGLMKARSSFRKLETSFEHDNKKCVNCWSAERQLVEVGGLGGAKLRSMTDSVCVPPAVWVKNSHFPMPILFLFFLFANPLNSVELTYIVVQDIIDLECGKLPSYKKWWATTRYQVILVRLSEPQKLTHTNSK